ncbi:MAG: bifunctional diaminohydroxyphosphoribosylaminopyrimidine deaminase/5-amino-6-(5-phosphoribosylamino)uracil reductase RibD [Blastocatellia bacterium]|nr:bifunctional diaminohydroxyphosphoribosylaminopyrimidine deaminase/5-amino-6-(5-phosphoribosylamino)uracil reductase RibD [Blastocatellia bacterium]MCS7157368.1 bifunctional diaminohydroxyphosphoribosylaminopyrimidine deaminase/5-amino-6-(5-phosphoribosylamino)uracil reductase RibD [Blastocatellia bacterium]MCX7753234.1 bifunctional diaminohydroxyphosphoribosylaminopyrimidine deaminase/5-amino-6-(5-phosphoribosylamino)uracil reductase RibD [Blastocatellia bacterium]MDW8168273.1 bifunctional d
MGLWRASATSGSPPSTVSAPTDEDYIRLALELAASAKGEVSPNPLVGALVVKEGCIVGRGVHRYAEVKHAEVLALEEAGERAQGATLYTNLEPCCHYGRTPPCTDAIIRAGIARVVACMMDPNPQVCGRGFEALRRAGIRVEVGIAEAEARQLNEKFVHYITSGRPFVHLKIAMSLDGRIATATGHSRWITGDVSRRTVHHLRHEYDAILVGIGTVLADDPELTDRSARPRHRPLVRVVLDSRLRIPLTSKLVRTARQWPLWIFTTEPLREHASHLIECGASVIPVPARAGRVDLSAVLDELGRREITSLLVEGGAEVHAAFLQQGLANKLTVFIAPKIIGGRGALPAIGGEDIPTLDRALSVRIVAVAYSGDDVEITAYPVP